MVRTLSTVIMVNGDAAKARLYAYGRKAGVEVSDAGHCGAFIVPATNMFSVSGPERAFRRVVEIFDEWGRP